MRAHWQRQILEIMGIDMSDLIERLRKRAEIRRRIPGRKSVQEGEPDRIADLLEEAADALERRQWVGLTYEDFAGMVVVTLDNNGSKFDSHMFARYVEAVLREKNT